MTQSNSPARRHVLWLVPLLLVLVLGAGCSEDNGTDPDPIPAEDPYYPSDYETTYDVALECRSFSGGHDLNTISIHVDPTASQQYIDQLFDQPLPVGTVIVKNEHSNPDTCVDVIRITVMRKGPAGTAPGSGDWEWQELDANGNVLQSGQIGECIQCHTDPTNDCGPDKDFTCLEFDE